MILMKFMNNFYTTIFNSGSVYGRDRDDLLGYIL